MLSHGLQDEHTILAALTRNLEAVLAGCQSGGGELTGLASGCATRSGDFAANQVASTQGDIDEGELALVGGRVSCRILFVLFDRADGHGPALAVSGGQAVDLGTSGGAVVVARQEEQAVVLRVHLRQGERGQTTEGLAAQVFPAEECRGDLTIDDERTFARSSAVREGSAPAALGTSGGVGEVAGLPALRVGEPGHRVVEGRALETAGAVGLSVGVGGCVSQLGHAQIEVAAPEGSVVHVEMAGARTVHRHEGVGVERSRTVIPLKRSHLAGGGHQNAVFGRGEPRLRRGHAGFWCRITLARGVRIRPEVLLGCSCIADADTEVQGAGRVAGDAEGQGALLSVDVQQQVTGNGPETGRVPDDGAALGLVGGVANAVGREADVPVHGRYRAVRVGAGRIGAGRCA